jgi:hypothetical protein
MGKSDRIPLCFVAGLQWNDLTAAWVFAAFASSPDGRWFTTAFRKT